MAGSTTTLDVLTSGQRNKVTTVNELMDAVSPPSIFGRHAAACVGLTWGYYGGAFRTAEQVVTQVANGVVALTDATTNYVECDGTGAVYAVTGGFTEGRTPLYTIVTSGSAVSSYVDERTGAHGAWSHTGRHIANLAYAASIDIDWALGYDIVRVTLTGDLTLTFQNGGDGQAMILEFTQDGTGGWNVTLPTDIRYSSDIPTFGTTGTPDTMDRIGVIRHASGSPQTYDLVALVRGFVV